MVTEADDAVSPKLSTSAVLSPITSAGGGGGLIISITDAMRSFLTASSTNSHLSNDLRDLSSSLSLQSTAPYQSLKSIWLGSESGSRPDLSSLLAGSNFVFTSPTPRRKVDSSILWLYCLIPMYLCVWILILVVNLIERGAEGEIEKAGGSSWEEGVWWIGEGHYSEEACEWAFLFLQGSIRLR